jgi:FkbM family methyltransferase
VLRDSKAIGQWLEHCPGRRECVQAGGNVGVFPKALAGHFATVYTAELDAENFADLTANGMPDNVRAFHSALGEQTGRVGCHHAPLPISHYVEPGDTVPMLAIDDWALQECDLIALDVEGYEWPAMKGAEATIRRCHPLLVIETKGHGSRYGYTDAEMAAWLEGLGYRMVERVNKDNVWRKA